MSTQEEEFEVRQEPDYVRKAGAVLVWFIGFMPMALGVVVAGAMWRGWVHTHHPNYDVPPPVGTVEHTLVENTFRGPDYDAQRAKMLTTWGWADEKHGVVRMPIDRAEKLVMERGR